MKKHSLKKKETIISVQNVSKKFKLYHEKKSSLKDFFIHFGRGSTYEEFYALQDITFDVKKGEFLGIVGRNGSGKSTLLKILAGVYVPDKGNVHIGGRLVPFLELGVGFNPELTARANVYLNGTILGLTKRQLDKKFDEIIEFAEIKEFVDMPLKKFSSGMQVRLAFSIAIQADADVFLLDEILAVGDASFQAKSMSQFRKFKEQGKTVILVTHDLSAVEQYCDRAVYIKEHKVQAIGKPFDILSKYIYQDRDESINNATPEEIEDKYKENAEVTKVEFIDKEGTQNDIFFAGDPINIKVHYKVKKRLEKPVFGVALYTEDGTKVWGYNTFRNQTYNEPYIEPGEYIAETSIKEMNVSKGNILVTVAITDDTHQTTYILEEKKFQFNVTPVFPHGGNVHMEAKWKLDK